MQVVTEGDRRKEVRALLYQIQAHPERDWTAARRRIATLNRLSAPRPASRHCRLAPTSEARCKSDSESRWSATTIPLPPAAFVATSRRLGAFRHPSRFSISVCKK